MRLCWAWAPQRIAPCISVVECLIELLDLNWMHYMKRMNFIGLRSIAVLLLLSPWFVVAAQAPQSEASSSAPSEVENASSSATAVTPMDRPVDRWTRQSAAQRPPMPPFFGRDRWRNRGGDDSIVAVGSDATLAAGQRTDNVVAIAGTASNAGEVSDSVVSVLGSTHVDGPVGNSAVAVLGNVYVNNKVDRDVVAVLGNVELGPQAEVGKVVAVMGQVIRDPAAVVRDGVQNVGAGMDFGGFDWLKSWIKNCFFYGRPLAFAPGLAWAWTLALGSLVLYVLTALMFTRGAERCVQTLEQHPGRSVLTAFLSVLLTPLLFVILAITVVGILAMPLLGIALLVMESFGKLVMLAWIGRSLTRSFKEGMFAHVAFAVLVGGLIVTGLYVVPVLGFVLYKLLGFIGFGAVAYTLLLAAQNRRANGAPQAMASASVGATPTSSFASSNNGGPDDGGAQMQSAAAQTNDLNTSQSGSGAAAHTMAAVEYPRAEFGVRMGALLIDALLAIVAFSWLPGSFLLALAVYGALMWKLKGTTIGGIVCNLQVVRMDGRELDWATVIVRALSCFLSLLVAGLGFFWIIFDADKQAWHDKLAGTVVVRLPKGVSLV